MKQLFEDTLIEEAKRQREEEARIQREADEKWDHEGRLELAESQMRPEDRVQELGKAMRDDVEADMNRALQPEDVKNQSHYTNVGMEPKVYIMANQMGFAEGNVIKYVSRYKLKGTPVKDLMKARDYIDWLIEEARKSSAD